MVCDPAARPVMRHRCEPGQRMPTMGAANTHCWSVIGGTAAPSIRTQQTMGFVLVELLLASNVACTIQTALVPGLVRVCEQPGMAVRVPSVTVIAAEDR